MSFKLIIAGGRDFNDIDLLFYRCDNILKNITSDIEIVSGNAKGADTLGEQYASKKGFSLKKFPANWSEYGKSAGVIRNKQMAEYADGLIAFWDGRSKGTKDMIEQAKKQGLGIRVIHY